MSTLKTHNLQSSDSGSVNIAMTPNAGMVVTGISTFNNKVLIGTANEGNAAADDLTISGSGEIGMTIRSTNSSQCNLFFSDGTSGAAEYAGVIRYDHATNSMRVWTNGDSEKLRIDSSGQLGVGTQSPNELLHVSGNSSGAITAKIENTYSSDATRFAILELKSGVGSIRFHDQGDTIEGEIKYDSTTNSMRFHTNGNSERLRIDSSGRVIIGGTSPVTDAQLTISANDAPAMAFQRSGSGKFESAIGMKTNSALRFYTGADSGSISGLAERMQIDASGHVMIGTTTEGFASYGDQFTIANTGHCGMTIRSGTSNYGTIYFSDGDDGSADEVRGFIDYNHSNNQLQIGTNAATRLRISSNGYVTKPATPAFNATHSGLSNSHTGYLTFNTSGSGYYNNGGHFDVSTGAFHAPVDGIYHFHFHGFFQVNQNNASFEVNFYRANSNGSNVQSMCRQYGYRQGVTSQYGPSISMHWTGPMSAGQTMRVHTSTLAFHGSNGFFFGGYLVG